MYLDKNLILYKISQQEIFNAYLFGGCEDIRTGRFYKNPLRVDNKAGCFFRFTPSGKLYFYDYAYPEFTGDCFHIVMCRYGCDFYEALQIICEDFFIDKGEFKRPISPYVAPAVINRLVDIRVKYMDFTPDDLAWWAAGGIKKSTLDLYRVKPALKVWINNRLWCRYSLRNPVYYYSENQRIKVYRPFSAKHKKFRTNMNRNMLEGWSVLPDKNSHLIITSSRKDVMCLYELGFTAVCPISESIRDFDDDIVSQIYQRFESVFVLFNNDPAGKEGALKLCNNIRACPIYIPDNLPKDPFAVISQTDFNLAGLINNKINER